MTGPRFVNIDRDTPLLLPPNLRDWVPADHLAHSWWTPSRPWTTPVGTGNEPYPPSMMLALAIYSYGDSAVDSGRPRVVPATDALPGWLVFVDDSAAGGSLVQ